MRVVKYTFLILNHKHGFHFKQGIRLRHILPGEYGSTSKYNASATNISELRGHIAKIVQFNMGFIL
jgi:hypothetical protein